MRMSFEVRSIDCNRWLQYVFSDANVWWSLVL